MSGPAVERLSIELGNRCRKACAFCYSASSPAGETRWTVADVVALVTDGARHGVRAVSFGGGEPLEVPALLFGALAGLRGVVFRSFTTSGLDLDAAFADVVAAAPDKVHVSIHHPGARAEVERVVSQVGRLAAAGIASGVNLLVARSQLAAAGAAAATLHAAGIDNRRIVYLPMRGDVAETPTPAELAAVAGVCAEPALRRAGLGPHRRALLVHHRAPPAGGADPRRAARGAGHLRPDLLRSAR